MKFLVKKKTPPPSIQDVTQYEVSDSLFACPYTCSEVADTKTGWLSQSWPALSQYTLNRMMDTTVELSFVS